MGNIEHSTDDWQPRPGEPHPVDEAFYKLAIKERDYERVRVDRLERQLRGAVEALRRIAANDPTDPTPQEAAERALDDLGLSHFGGQ